MNDFYTEDLLEVAKQKAQRKVTDAQSSRKDHKVSLTKLLLGTLGTWMVAGGEKLQSLNAEALQANQLKFSQNKAGKVRG